MLPSTMRAARFVAVGKPLELEDVPVPRPGPGEVLVRVRACGLCGSDVHIVEGTTPTAPPLVLGHEPAGDIAALGPGVAGWSEGDRVAVLALRSCGTCEQCTAGRMQVCATRQISGIHLDGGLAEYLLTPASTLVALPAEVPYDVGAILSDAVATPFHALRDRALLRAGETVAVFGAGGLGMHAVELARLMGAALVVAVDVRPAALERAREFGADVVVDASAEDPVTAVLDATAGRGVDVAAEFVGRRTSIEQAIASTATAGRAVVVGLGPEPLQGPPPTVFVRKEASVLASYASTRGTVRTLVDLLAARRLDLRRSITHTYDLEDADEALRVLRTKQGDPLRVVVRPG